MNFVCLYYFLYNNIIKMENKEVEEKTKHQIHYEKYKSDHKEWREKNREKMNAYYREYNKKRNAEYKLLKEQKMKENIILEYLQKKTETTN